MFWAAQSIAWHSTPPATASFTKMSGCTTVSENGNCEMVAVRAVVTACRSGANVAATCSSSGTEHTESQICHPVITSELSLIHI